MSDIENICPVIYQMRCTFNNWTFFYSLLLHSIYPYSHLPVFSYRIEITSTNSANSTTFGGRGSGGAGYDWYFVRWGVSSIIFGLVVLTSSLKFCFISIWQVLHTTTDISNYGRCPPPNTTDQVPFLLTFTRWLSSFLCDIYIEGPSSIVVPHALRNTVIFRK